MLKKRIAVISAFILILGLLVSSNLIGYTGLIFANAGYTMNIEVDAALSGEVSVSASSATSGESLSVTVGDAVVPASQSSAVATLRYVTTANTNYWNTSTKLRFGGSNPALIPSTGTGGISFKSDGQEGIEIPVSSLSSGINHVRIVIGGIYGNKSVYDTSRAHGITAQGANMDDFIISGMVLMLPGGIEIVPSRIIQYKGKELGKVGYVTEEENYDPMKDYWIGDGWQPNGEAYAGHSNPRLNIPFMVDLVFNVTKPASVFNGQFNTASLPDGNYDIVLKAGTENRLTRSVVIDNTKPAIEVNLKENQIIENGYRLEADFEDRGSGLKAAKVTLRGDRIAKSVITDPSESTLSVVLNDLEYGLHSVVLSAEDAAGNINYLFRQFFVSSSSYAGFSENLNRANSEYEITLSSSDTMKLYSADKLNIEAGYGVRADNNNENYNIIAEYGDIATANITNGTAPAVLSSSLGSPYQTFTVDVTGKTGNVVISYSGGAEAGERFAVKAYNKLKKEWVTVAGGVGQQQLSFVLNTIQYAVNDKINLVVTLDYVDNGSNRILWFSDPQYLTKFDDLNFIYNEVMEYTAGEYKAGRTAYLTTSGDIVEDYLGSGTESEVKKQWDTAKQAFKYLDDNDVPYGIVSGNHDTGTNITSLDYNYYTEYFGDKNYQNRLWYGGSLNNNISHYDLITAGGYDFIFVYLGYGVEGRPETIEWVNRVLSRYSHRNAVLVTHAYLMGDGTEDAQSRYDVILNEMVKPNANVKFLLCGHNEGANKKTYVLDGGRPFTVFLSDYQFIEYEDYDTPHEISGLNCNGEGYMREIFIEQNKIRMSTFTPVYDTNYLPYGKQDEFEMAMNFIKPQRTLTTNAISAVVLGGEISAGITNAGNGKHTLDLSSISGSFIAEVTDANGTAAYSFAHSVTAPPAAGVAPVINTEYQVYEIYKAAILTYAGQLESSGSNPFTAASYEKFQQLLAGVDSTISASSGSDAIFNSYMTLKLAFTSLTDIEAVERVPYGDSTPVTPVPPVTENPENPDEDPDGGFPVWAIVLISVGGAALLGGAVVCFFVIRKKTAKA